MINPTQIHDYHPEYDHHPDHHQPLDSYSHHEEVAYNYHYNDHPPPYEHHHEEEHSEYQESPGSGGKPIHYEFHSVSDSGNPNFGGGQDGGKTVGMKEAYAEYPGMGMSGVGAGGGQSSKEGDCSDEEGAGGKIENSGKEVMYQYKEEMLKPMMLPIMTNHDEGGGEQKMMMMKPSKNPFTGGRKKRPGQSGKYSQQEPKYLQQEPKYHQQEGMKYHEEQFMQMMKYEHPNEAPDKYSKELLDEESPKHQSYQEERPKYQSYQEERPKYQEQKHSQVQNEQYSVHHGMYGMKMGKQKSSSEENEEEGGKPSSEDVSVSSSEFLDKNDKESGGSTLSKQKYKTVTTSYFPYVQGADYKDQQSYNDDPMSKEDIDKYADIYK